MVEAFLQLRSNKDDVNAPYLEIQVSPRNQPFALVIVEPRKTYFAPEKLEFKTTSNPEGRIWSGSMEVNLPDELKGEFLYGGFFACLSKEPREFLLLSPILKTVLIFTGFELFLALDME